MQSASATASRGSVVTRMDPLRVGDDGGIGKIPERTGDADVHACGGAAQQIRVGHVVGRIAEIGDGLARQSIHTATMLRDGEQVGEHLTGVELVGQRVDDRAGGVFRHLFDAVLTERSPDDAVGHAGEHSRSVGDRLAAAQLGTGLVDDQRIPAEFRHADGEAGTGAGGGLVEQHGDGLGAGERLTVEAVLAEFHAEFQNLLLFGMVDVVVTQHMAKLTGHEVLLLWFGMGADVVSAWACGAGWLSRPVP